ncbi:MAG: LysM peptidoglycan-binding domain-containing protein, partial [Deltaproteobacteria bacterium]|nr:LysM peptidoglycan-binding domain-containing protein [Deltaproteobacteria bacterium]
PGDGEEKKKESHGEARQFTGPAHIGIEAGEVPIASQGGLEETARQEEEEEMARGEREGLAAGLEEEGKSGIEGKEEAVEEPLSPVMKSDSAHKPAEGESGETAAIDGPETGEEGNGEEVSEKMTESEADGPGPAGEAGPEEEEAVQGEEEVVWAELEDEGEADDADVECGTMEPLQEQAAAELVSAVEYPEAGLTSVGDPGEVMKSTALPSGPSPAPVDGASGDKGRKWLIYGLLLFLLMLALFVVMQFEDTGRDIEKASIIKKDVISGRGSAGERSPILSETEGVKGEGEEKGQKIGRLEEEPSSVAAEAKGGNEEDTFLLMEIEALTDKISLKRTKTVPKGSRIYKVRKGDTLWDIAESMTGNPFDYRSLAADSKIKNPDLIYPGQKILIRIIEGD